MRKKKIDKLASLYIIVAVFVAVLSIFSFTFAWYVKTGTQYLNVRFAPPIVINVKSEATIIQSVGDDLDSLIPGSKFAVNLGLEMAEESSTAYVRAKMAVRFEDVYDENNQLLLWTDLVHIENAITDSWVEVDFSGDPNNPDIWYVCKTSVGTQMISREVSPGDQITFANGTIELSLDIDNRFAEKKIEVVMIVESLQVVGVEDPLANGLIGAKYHEVWGKAR